MESTPQLHERNPFVTRLSYGVIFLLIVFALLSVALHTIRFYRTVHALKTLHTRHIKEFRLYPRTTLARGKPIIFSPSENIVDEFLKALSDIRAYRGNPSKIASIDHEWFVEIKTSEGHIIQMRCHLPANKGPKIHGSLGRFYEKGGGAYYGKFQSQRLYEWYQTYSHLWLGENKENEEISIEFSP